MTENKWRFPTNGYTAENGLDTTDMETFKKDPVSSLAREICQNSIDASANNYPVRVEFKLFTVDRNEIPNIDELTEQINKCYEYKKSSAKEGPSLTFLKSSIEKQQIKCLRISDFNTTGVSGAVDNHRDTPFYYLTKGAGVSDKPGASGGSKGIGKFASFVVSTTNTVFYSTRAKDNTNAYIGISKLRSVPINDDEDLMTMGIGYYGSNERNYPILEELHIDKDFSRDKDDYGTDVYIIGFDDTKGWQSDIVAKVLDSFMVAIRRGKLEVSVGDYEVNSDTIKTILDNSKFQNERSKKELRDIRAQYELLEANDETISCKELDIEGNKVITYVKQYSAQDEGKATKHCVMIRYPYMKITHITTGAFIPFSALCIIEKNNLNERLRTIENPQHTDWEIKRLNDFPDEKKNTHRLKLAFENAVKDYITSVLQTSSSDSTDVEGAGEFLPSQDEVGINTGSIMSDDQVRTKAITMVTAQNPKTDKAGENGEGYEFGEGDTSDTGPQGRKPRKKPRKNPKPNPEPKEGPKQDDPMINEGKESVLRMVPLSGMRYRTVVTDKKNGRYDCIFNSLHTEDNCDFELRLCGEANDKYPIKIQSASIDGIPCKLLNGKIIDLKIEAGKTYKISYTVNSHEMFASEVIMNAYRK